MNLEIATFTECLHCKQACNQNLSSPNLFALLAICKPRHPLETTLHTDSGDTVISS
ncbi:hypothetical protein K443DRAFT_686341 [Laccaria amethystina LaAM-08-1]|uniref:Uncharacterized protein n=1 Tax=Laccaria amethystina LaAM-08-1 TaxID=1095629 RepID=A0A0C9WHD3_9AGAR|nr:hypothetical protein K443DRAFT_686341 [Laccaria amethystina LaAM-08-1]